jgi:glycine/sarcosine N-methyltransferase
MAFYTDLSDVYDAIFPVSEAQRTLFESLLAGGRLGRVADAGCGTGSQLLSFASAGVECVGFDPDPALVARARAKLAPYPRACVEEGGFEDVSRIVSSPADLILCLGNSLVHVPQEEAARFLRDAAGTITNGGEILLQILNYERLLLGKVTALPLMQAEEGAIEFRRGYVWEGDRKVRFQTVLRISEGGEPRIVRNDIPLYPIYPDELWEMMDRAGFSRIRFFGDFAGSEFLPGSDALVCLAGKR